MNITKDKMIKLQNNALNDLAELVHVIHNDAVTLDDDKVMRENIKQYITQAIEHAVKRNQYLLHSCFYHKTANFTVTLHRGKYVANYVFCGKLVTVYQRGNATLSIFVRNVKRSIDRKIRSNP